MRAIPGRRQILRSGATAGMTCLALLAGGLVGAVPAAQAATIPTNPCIVDPATRSPSHPVITRVRLAPAEIDVRRHAGAAIVTVKVHDDVDVSRVRATITRIVTNVELRLVSGTRRAGFWRTSVPMPRGLRPGRYQVTHVQVWDVGGVRTFRTDRLPAGVLAPAVRVRSYVDRVAPTVSAFRVSTRKVDTRTAAQTVTFRVDARDAISGVANVAVAAYGIDSTLVPAGSAYRGVGGNLVRSSTRKNRWVGRFVVPMWAGISTWDLSMIVKDKRRHLRHVTTKNLARRGWQSTLRVVSGRDPVPPRLAALSFTPTSVDARTGAATVDVTWRVTDALSGVASRTRLDFSGVEVVVTSTSGTANDRTYHGRLVVPQCGSTIQSTWVVRADLFDNAGNESWIGPGGIVALGFADELAVQQRDAYAPQIINDPTAFAGGSLPLRFSEPVLMSALPSSLLRVAVNGTTATGTWECRNGRDDVVVCDADDAAVVTATFTPTTAFVTGQEVTVGRVTVPPARIGIYDLDGVPLTQVAVDTLVG